MDNILKVCVTCRKTDCGDGVWQRLAQPAAADIHKSLCPECCHARFPHFYSDVKRRESSRPGFLGKLSALAGFLKP